MKIKFQSTVKDIHFKNVMNKTHTHTIHTHYIYIFTSLRHTTYIQINKITSNREEKELVRKKIVQFLFISAVFNTRIYGAEKNHTDSHKSHSRTVVNTRNNTN